MIVTVTVNPVLDKTATLLSLTPGGLNRLEQVRVDPAGKGINVSKMLAVLGEPSIATGFLGDESGRELARRLQAFSIESRFVQVAGVTRTNLKVIDPVFGLTEFNEPGVFATSAEVEALWVQLRALAKPGTLFVLGGTLHQGARDSFYQTLTQKLTALSAKVLLDCSGAALQRALEGTGPLPQVIKPNKEEFCTLFALPPNTPRARLLPLCRQLVERGVALVALSLGGEGALFVSREQSLFAPGLSVRCRSPVGAGDSMMGALAFALQKKLPLTEAAALAMACSAGAVMTDGTAPPSREVVECLLPQVTLIPEN